MRKTLALLSLTAALLGACTDPDKTPMSQEEDYFMNAYAVITSGQAYDEVCNKGQMAKNATLAANLSMISTQVYESFRRNHPDTPDHVFKEAVTASGKTMRDSQVEMLKEKGCDAPELKPFAEALAHFTSVPAEANFTRMMQDVAKMNTKRDGAPVPDPAGSSKHDI